MDYSTMIFCDNNVVLRTGERATVTDRFQQAAEH